MAYKVRVKPDHPYQSYNRSGHTFFTNEDTIVEDDEMTEEIKNDARLIVEEMTATTRRRSKSESE